MSQENKEANEYTKGALFILVGVLIALGLPYWFPGLAAFGAIHIIYQGIGYGVALVGFWKVLANIDFGL